MTRQLPPILALAALIVSACSAVQDWKPPAERARRWPSRAGFSLYSHAIADDWAPHEQQSGLGLDVIVQPRGRRLGFEVIGLLGGDGLLAPGDEPDLVSRFVGVGAHASFDQDPPIVPFIGVGFAFVDVEVDSPGAVLADQADSSVGYYGRIGLDWIISDAFFVGVAYQALGGTDVELEGFSSDDVNGDWVLFRVGVGF
jgi:opacity protein-like surface antigen